MQRIIIYVFIIFLIMSCSKLGSKNNKILFVTSNQHTYGDTKINASNHFEEIVLAYDVFTKNNYNVDFISPEGGAIPLGYISTSDSIQKHYIYNNEFMNRLKNTKNPHEVVVSNYKAIYYSGGGSAMFGIAEDVKIQNLAKEIYNNKGVISTICHGTAGIANLKDNNGISLYFNKKITGYPDIFERKSAKYYKTFPFSIEKKIKENKGDFIYSNNFNDNFFIVDGRFVTGQDPSASKLVAENVIKLIK